MKPFQSEKAYEIAKKALIPLERMLELAGD